MIKKLQFLLSFNFLFPLLGIGQITILDHASNNGVSTTYSGFNGSNRLLVMVIAAEFNSADNITGVTWGGKSLTSVVSVSSGASVDNVTCAYYLNEANIASHSGSTVTVSCTTGGANIRSLTCEIIMLSGVLQSTPISETVTKTASSTNTISITSGINSDNKDMVIAAVSSSKNNITFTTGGTGFTELADVQAAQHTYSVSTRSITASGTSSSPSFTGSANSSRLAMIAFEVNSTYDPLPVEFINFNWESIKKEVQLSWSVASEIDNDFFEIDHSVDGTEWNKVNITKSIGNHTSVVNYIYIDHQPSSGINYYRLLQQDLDGTKVILKVITFQQKQSTNLSFEDLLLSHKNSLCRIYKYDGRIIYAGRADSFFTNYRYLLTTNIYIVCFPDMAPLESYYSNDF